MFQEKKTKKKTKKWYGRFGANGFFLVHSLDRFHERLLGFTEFCRVELDFNQFLSCTFKLYRVSMGSTGFLLVIRSLTKLGWVLLDFTGFYWVLLGFTGFYWV